MWVFTFWTHSCFPLGWWGTFACYKFLTLWWGTIIVLKMKVFYLKFLRWGFSNRTLSINYSLFSHFIGVFSLIFAFDVDDSLCYGFPKICQLLQLSQLCLSFSTCHRIHRKPDWMNHHCKSILLKLCICSRMQLSDKPYHKDLSETLTHDVCTWRHS